MVDSVIIRPFSYHDGFWQMWTPLCIKYWVTYRGWVTFLALNSHIESADCWEEDRNTNDATDTRLMLHCVESWRVTTGRFGDFCWTTSTSLDSGASLDVERRFTSTCTYYSQSHTHTLTQILYLPFLSLEHNLWLLLSSSCYSDCLSSSISTPGVC